MVTSPPEPVRTGPRFERKLLLDETRAGVLQAWTAARCAPDPHADPADPAYLVESVYCDTEDFAIWKSAGPARMARYRLRRYGSGACFLEEKLRLQERVWKRRAPCPASSFAALCRGEEPVLDGQLPWFAGRFRAFVLRPTAVIAYRRYAFQQGDVRITFDRQVRAWPVGGGADPFARTAEPALVVAGVVLEVKHAGPPDAMVRELTQLTGGLAGGCSKYGRAVSVLGLAPGAERAQRA